MIVCILGALLAVSFAGVAGAVQTINYIPKFATPPAIDNSVIYQSGTNIGIGTTSPLNALHVNSGTANNVVLFESTDPGAVILLKDSLTTASEAICRCADDLDLRTNWTPRLTVKGGTGWVGINTGAPLSSLDVRGSVNIRDGAGAAVITFGATGAHPDLYIRSDDDPTTYEPQSERLYVGGNGNVGVGTPAPTHRLTVDADATGPWATDPGNAQLALRGATDKTLELALGVDTTNAKGRIQAADLWVAPIDLLLQPAGGNVGIGCTTASQKLQVAGTIYSTTGGFKFPDGTTQTTAATGSGGWVDAGTVVRLATSTDKVGIGTSAPSKALTVRGNILIERTSSPYTPVLELGEGLDYAEGFDVTDSVAPAPGTVLVIDADNPGRLTTAAKAYDTRVAGIVAGAKGLSSAVRLGVGQFDCDVALAGRVYCNVDATESGVQPGDLLTTSSVAGYAMKARDPSLTHGAILGKAMQSLEKGQKGQILVLVTLQ